MKRKISGRELILFIAKFKLWDAHVHDVCIVDGEIKIRIFPDSKYKIQLWNKDEEEWEVVEKGDVFKMDSMGGLL